MIRLVGAWRIIDPDHKEEDAVASFYGEVFPRLAREVDGIGGLSRYVGYRALSARGGILQFFGIEVDKIKNIPPGMVAWELTPDQWRVWNIDKGQSMYETGDAFKWIWNCQSPDGELGEFKSFLPVNAPGGFGSDKLVFWATVNSYAAFDGRKADPDIIELIDYDPTWPDEFEKMAGQLRKMWNWPEVRIEHYGSTAVPGLKAKPIIDMLVEVPSFDEARRIMLPALNDAQWEYWWYSDHMIFIKRDKLMGKRTHHVHAAPAGHRIWEGLTFRNLLRNKPDTAAEYAALKSRLATVHRSDREEYTRAKTEFIKMHNG